jgi:hypothetical protein
MQAKCVRDCYAQDEHYAKLHFGFCMHGLFADLLLYNLQRIMNSPADAPVALKPNHFMECTTEHSMENKFCVELNVATTVIDFSNPVNRFKAEKHKKDLEHFLGNLTCADGTNMTDLYGSKAQFCAPAAVIPQKDASELTSRMVKCTIPTALQTAQNTHAQMMCMPAQTSGWVMIPDVFKDLKDPDSGKWGWVTCGEPSTSGTRQALSITNVKCKSHAGPLVVGYLRSYMEYMGSVSVQVFSGDEKEPLIKPLTISSLDTSQRVSIYTEKIIHLPGKNESPLELSIDITPVEKAVPSTVGECPNKFKLLRVACY